MADLTGLEGEAAKTGGRACAKPGSTHAPPLLRPTAPRTTHEKTPRPGSEYSRVHCLLASTLLCAPLSRESLGLLGDVTLRSPLTGGTTASSPGFDSHSHISSRSPIVAGCPNFFFP